MSRHARKSLLVGGVLLFTAACTSFGPGAPELTSNADAGESDADAGESDASADAGDAADAQAFGPNLVDNGGFERPGDPCAQGWSASNAFQATLTRTSEPAHSGTAACMLCADVGVPYYTLDLNRVTDAKPNQRYVLRIWLARAPGTKQVQGTIYFRVRQPGASTTVEQVHGEKFEVGDRWEPHEFAYTLTQAGVFAPYVELRAPSSATCVLVDDVEVVQQL